MNIYEVTPKMYIHFIVKLRGYVFYRIDKNNRHLIKPFGKFADNIVSKFGKLVIE